MEKIIEDESVLISVDREVIVLTGIFNHDDQYLREIFGQELKEHLKSVGVFYKLENLKAWLAKKEAKGNANDLNDKMSDVSGVDQS